MNGETGQVVRFEEKAACEVCGRFGAYLFEGKALCGECYEASGSCCQEVVKDGEQPCGTAGEV